MLNATGGQDGYIKVWDPQDPVAPLVEEKLGLLWLLSIEWISDNCVATAADDGIVRLVTFNIRERRVSSSSITCHIGAVWDIAVRKVLGSITQTPLWEESLDMIILTDRYREEPHKSCL